MKTLRDISNASWSAAALCRFQVVQSSNRILLPTTHRSLRGWSQSDRRLSHSKGFAWFGARERFAACAGWTLIEIIGVLAVISILVAVVAPSVIRRVDRAA